MIPQNFIDEIQTRIDIVELINSYIPLKKAGRNFKANCPFHNEKTPSFFVSPQRQIFHCFGCGVGGGAIQFIMLYEKVNFIEAIDLLARRLGLSIPYEDKRKDTFKSILYRVVTEAADFYHNLLLNNKEVLSYLNKRGLKENEIKLFKIGYAPGRKILLNYLREKNFSLKVLESASLIVSKNDSYYDLFNERIIFPIWDIQKRIIAFGARVLVEREGIPKYINSLDNPLYSKREHLFGLNFAKEEILKKDEVIVVEGYLDMIIPFTYGIKNIVASLGTALTQEQINLLKRYTSNIILVFDADKAGQQANLRAIDLLLENGCNVYLLKLPDKKDPDLIVRERGKEYFEKLISCKENFFEYKWQILKNIYDPTTLEGKNKIVNEMFLTFNRLRSEIEKYEYISRLAEYMKIREEILIVDFRKFLQDNNKKSYLEKIKDEKKEAIPLTEKIILKGMLINEKAFKLAKEHLRKEDFTSLLTRKTADYFFKQKEEDLKKIINFIEDKEISSFISCLIMDDDVKIDNEVFKSSILKLQKKRKQSVKEELRKKIQEAEYKGDKDKLERLIKEYSILGEKDE